MPIPGYDPDDLDETLDERLAERDRSAYLSPEEQRRYEGGESLVDLLDTDQILDLLSESDAEPDPVEDHSEDGR